jgi:hypothetical protein
MTWLAHAAVGEKLSHNIHLSLISFGGLDYLLGLCQPPTLPLLTALHRPREDAWQFRRELLQELRIFLLVVDSDSEGNQANAAADRIIPPPNDGLVIGDQPNLSGNS